MTPIGCHFDIPASVYHADPGASASRLKRIALESPLHCMLEMRTPIEPTPAMVLGTLVHQAILEPGQPLPMLAVVPESYTVPEDYKPASKRDVQPGEVVEWSFRRKHCQQWRKAQEEAGRIVLSRDDADVIWDAAKAVGSHSLAAGFFNDADAEVSMFWETEDGSRCKARLDLVPRGSALVDVKFTNDASPRAFAKHVVSMGYHIQAAWYLMAWETCGTGKRDDFFFVAIEQGTCAVTVHKLSHDLIEEGKRVALGAFARWKRCMETGAWPGYDEVVHVVDKPRWMRGEGEE